MSMIGMFAAVTGCRERYDFKPVVHYLDSLQSVWNAEWTAPLNAFDTSFAALADTAQAELDFVQNHFKGRMKWSRGEELSRFHNVISNTQELEKAHEALISQQAHEQHQLQMLRKALLDKATHDAQGNEITPDYVQKAISIEITEHRHRMEQLKKFSEHLSVTSELFDDLHPVVHAMSDSLHHRLSHN